MKIKIFCAFFLLTFYFSFAQEVEYSGLITGKGIVFSGEESPFWFHTNQRGHLDELSNVAGWATGMASYPVGTNARLSVGVGVLYSNGYTNEVQLDESYLGFDNSWLAIHIGRRQRAEIYRGLSASNQNILWSLNARPLAGASFEIIRPVYFWKNAGLAFQASLEEFITDDDRFVPDTRIHHKSFFLIFDKIENIEFTAGLHHFVQWAGTSPEFGALPDGFNDYLKVFSGRGTNEEVGGGNEVNAVGNHLGSYVAGIKTSFKNYNVEILYNHLFEDGSGRRLGNTPDGRYGIFIQDKIPGKWVGDLMYEFYYTKHQSHSSPSTDGKDNYFQNQLYRSGWTYENRILGLPFITLNDERLSISNNSIIAHHIGVSGILFDSLPYKLLTSYRQNFGAKGVGNLRSDILSTYIDLNVYQNIFQINLQLGTDFSTIDSPNFGAGIQISKKLF